MTRGGSTPTFYAFGSDGSGGGANWAPLAGGDFSGRSLSFDVSSDGQKIIATEDGRFTHWISLHGGVSWSETAINQANGLVAISPLDSRLIIFGSQERLHRSASGLATSTRAATAPQPTGHPRAAPFQQIAFAPSDPTIVYAATEGYLLLKSVDSGATLGAGREPAPGRAQRRSLGARAQGATRPRMYRRRAARWAPRGCIR